MEAVELMSAGACNMACSYCFIPKNQEMTRIHQKIIESFKDGTYLNYLKENKPIYLSLWGTEPTLTMEHFIPLVKELTWLKEIKFSTNLLTNHLQIVELAKEVEKLKNCKLDIQISLDGPTCITDKNRCKNATNKIVSHFKEIKELLKPHKFVEIHFKPTITIDNIKNDLNTLDKVIEWYKFFDCLTDEKIPPPTPTFEVPGNYTSEDGKLAGQFFRHISEVKRLNKKKRFLKHYDETNNYVLRFKKLLNFNRELQYKFRMFTCSGGDTQYGLDFNGNMHICHHTFFYDNPEYFNQAYGDKLHERGFKNTSFHKDNEYNKSRIMYTNRCYHDFMRFKINTTIVMIKELMLCGQVSDDFKNDDLCYALALLLHTGFSCPAENKMRTGSILIPPISLIRLLGNGCMQEIIKNV
jgi:sulfatase maturation enzyme AslB (radical SAM superfamily)